MKIKHSTEQIAKSKEISSKNMGIEDSVSFELCGESFVIMPRVFSPQLFPSAKIYYPKFPYRNEERVLEIGSGAGYGSILIAKRGAKKVVSTDINPAAVENTRLNVQQHGLTDQIEVIQSDLFENVTGTFSTIYWNHPFITAPDDYEYSNIVERAIFDPGYHQLKRFLDEARNHLAPGGRILVGLADVGGLDYFRKLADEFGYTEREVIREKGIEGNEIEVTLHELVLGERE